MTEIQAYLLSFSGFDETDSREKIDAIATDLYKRGYAQHTEPLDVLIAKSRTCDECGSDNLSARGFYRHGIKGVRVSSYRVFAVCNGCGSVREL